VSHRVSRCFLDQPGLVGRKERSMEIECKWQLVVRIAHITNKLRLPFNCDISIYSVI